MDRSMYVIAIFSVFSKVGTLEKEAGLEIKDVKKEYSRRPPPPVESFDSCVLWVSHLHEGFH